MYMYLLNFILIADPKLSKKNFGWNQPLTWILSESYWSAAKSKNQCTYIYIQWFPDKIYIVVSKG